MRTRYWILSLALLLGGLSVPARAADNVVDGYGRDSKAAKQVALEHAQVRVLEMLHEQLGPDWRPAPGQLDPDFLAAKHVIHQRGEPVVTEVDGERMMLARYDVALTPEYLKAVQDTAWQQRVEARRAITLRILAALVALLGVTTGYLRLEQATRGYYTRLLRVGAVVLVLLTGAGLWLSL